MTDALAIDATDTVRRVVEPTRRSRVNGHRRRVVVAGATGYIGRRLVAELVAGGHHVRCLARTPNKLDAEPWRAEVEVVAGDVLDVESLAAAFHETDAAYFLVHSIGSQPDWQTRDRTAAENFRDAAAAADLEQIVYLGGLGDDAGGTLSPHLASRHEVGRILAAGRVPLTELRAAVVIGSGSASFEMLRHLVEVLPVMTTPRWVETRVQPIAVRDVLAYLIGVLGNADAYGRVFEIGGADVVTYHEMMDMYAQAAGLRRRVILPVPVLSPRLSSLWVGLVTPIPAELARPLRSWSTTTRSTTWCPASRSGAVTRSSSRCDESARSTHLPAGPTPTCTAERPRIRCPPIPSGRAPPCSPTVKSSTPTRHPTRSSARCARWAATAVGSSATACG